MLLAQTLQRWCYRPFEVLIYMRLDVNRRFVSVQFTSKLFLFWCSFSQLAFDTFSNEHARFQKQRCSISQSKSCLFSNNGPVFLFPCTQVILMKWKWRYLHGSDWTTLNGKVKSALLLTAYYSMDRHCCDSYVVGFSFLQLIRGGHPKLIQLFL